MTCGERAYSYGLNVSRDFNFSTDATVQKCIIVNFSQFGREYYVYKRICFFKSILTYIEQCRIILKCDF